MAHTTETRRELRRLYIENLPLKGAALSTGVSYCTAIEWKKSAKADGDDWDDARAAYQISGAGVEALGKQFIESFYRQGLATMREIDSGKLSSIEKVKMNAQIADAASKFAKMFGQLDPRLSALSVSLDTLKIITDYLRQNDPKSLALLHGHLDAIGTLIGDRYG